MREKNSLVSKPESEEEDLGVCKEGILARGVGEREMLARETKWADLKQ